ncbi:hypothetical protein TNCV_349211 [Trichonephila clavipes]|nr:hypothetical protein TNCV_349211 [Trichonephila clavipes]
MPPNSIRVHTEYVLSKSVGPKVLWSVAAEITGAWSWRIFPYPPIPCRNWGRVEIVGVNIYRVRGPTCFRLRQLPFLASGKDTTTKTTTITLII